MEEMELLFSCILPSRNNSWNALTIQVGKASVHQCQGTPCLPKDRGRLLFLFVSHYCVSRALIPFKHSGLINWGCSLPLMEKDYEGKLLPKNFPLSWGAKPFDLEWPFLCFTTGEEMLGNNWFLKPFPAPRITKERKGKENSNDWLGIFTSDF